MPTSFGMPVTSCSAVQYFLLGAGIWAAACQPLSSSSTCSPIRSSWPEIQPECSEAR